MQKTGNKTSTNGSQQIKPSQNNQPSGNGSLSDQYREGKYSKVAIYLHWIIAFLMIINVVLGWSADSMPEASIRFAVDTHKSIGISVLGLVLLRLLWRFSHQPPALPKSLHHWEITLAHLGHIGLYILMLAIPISGWLHDSAWKDAATHPMQLFYSVPWPRIGLIEHMEPVSKEVLHTVFGSVHEWLGIALVILFFLHIAAVIKHSWIDHKSVLNRMLP